MILNLTDEQATDMLLEHDEDALRQQLHNFPELARKATQQDDVFWQRQQRQISVRISGATSQRGSAAAMVWATGFAVLLLFCFQTDRGLRMDNGLRAGRMTPAVQSRSRNVSDGELLVKIEQEIGNVGPEALTPAALLAQEISQSSTPDISNSDRTERDQ